MKSKKLIRMIFSASAYIILMSFFGCEKSANIQSLLELQNNIVSTLTFAIP